MTFDVSKTTILIVGSSHETTVLTTVLRSEGYRMAHSSTEQKDFENAINVHYPDLIVMALEAPYETGFETLDKLKKLSQEKQLPLLACLEEAPSNVREYILTQADELISKQQSSTEKQLRIKNLIANRVQSKMQKHHKDMLERAFKEKTQQLAQLNSSLQSANKNLEATTTDILLRLAKAAEYRDDGSEAHTLRVGRLANMTAKALGLDEDFCELILLAARLHDVGKIGIPDSILLRPGKLSYDEEIYLRDHCVIGAELLASDGSELLRMAETIALTHHERWDGQGYPNNLKADCIPIAGRITSVVDVFDTLTHTRPYRRAWSREEALELLREERGRHFDPQVIDAFMSIVDTFTETGDEAFEPERPNYVTMHF